MASGPSVLVRFLGDNSDLKKAADDTSSSANKLVDFGKKAGLAVAGGFAADKVVEFGKSSVEAAAADKRAQDLLAQTLKNSGHATDAQVASTEKSIAAMSKHYAVADDDLRPALGNLVRATGDVTKSQDLLQIALDASAGTGKDLGSITLAMGKAADGSTGALSKLGIETKDAGGKALGADQVFQNMAKTFKGEAGVAAESAAGKMAGAKIQFGEFQESVGNALLPVISQLSDLLANTLMPVLQKMADWMAEHKTAMTVAMAAIATVISIAVIPAFVVWAASAVAAGAATLLAAAPFIAIGLVIAGVAYLIIHNWDTIKEATQKAWDFVLGIVRGVWNWISNNWPLLLAIITGPIGLAVLAITKHWDAIKDGAKKVWDFIKGGWDGLIGFFTGIPGRITSALSGMWNFIKDGFRGAINGVIDLWNRLQFKVPGFKIGPVGFDGITIKMPDIPHLAEGGLITGDGLVFAHAGEVISPAPGPASSIVIENVNIGDGADVDLLLSRLRFAVSAGRL